MLVGAVPALLTLFIRLFVPESEKWTAEKEAGEASHWSGRDLIGVLIGAAAAWSHRAVGSSETRLVAPRRRVAGRLVVVIVGYLTRPRGYLLRSGLSVEGARRRWGGCSWPPD